MQQGKFQAPRPQQNWALLLDLDGTLLDIADTPDQVVVPPELVRDIDAARIWLGGALAVISGRSQADLERLLWPLDLDYAAEHGALIRRNHTTTATGKPVCQHWLDSIRIAARHWPGVLVEAKTCSVAVHYRRAPHHAADVGRLVHSVAAADGGFEVVEAHMAFEIRDRNANKAGAVRVFMEMPPFAGRTPVFIGDDTTDEDGIREAELGNGIGLRVATTFGGKPSNVRLWLREFR